MLSSLLLLHYAVYTAAVPFPITTSISIHRFCSHCFPIVYRIWVLCFPTASQKKLRGSRRSYLDRLPSANHALPVPSPSLALRGMPVATTCL